MAISILGIVGSLHTDSLNKKILDAFIARAPEGVEVVTASIDIPLYSQDKEATMPEEALSLKKKIETADGVIIVTPEYNRSIPGSLKNMIDWVSRPYGKNSFDGKVVGVAGGTDGLLGTALAQYHLKQILLYLNAILFGQPEFMISNTSSKFNETGVLVDEATISKIDAFWKTMLDTIDAYKK